ncbi:MAG TPA: hypothetical protein VFK68_00285 [Propionibacteriaceae bacterium]|nr:hypothetical protein [Propionibacteriaceae bacterium]
METIASLDPQSAPRGRAPLGAQPPWVDLLLPRHAVGATGSDILQWESRTTYDEDEVETEYVSGTLRAVVQHTASADAWRLRGSIANTGPDPVSLSRADLAVDPSAGTAWVWAAGSAGLLAVDDDSAGLWALALRRGMLTADGGDTVWLEAGTTLDPGRRVTVELTGGRYQGWEEVASLLPAWLPRLAVRGGEPVDLALPDAGVVASGCTLDEGPEGTEIRGSGVQQVSVRGAFGEVTLELAFAPTLAEAVDASSRRIAGEVGEQGELAGVRPEETAADLERASRRLLVLQAARSHDAADVVASALVVEAAQLVHRGESPGTFTVVALAGEVQRRDDREALAALLLAMPLVIPEPGMALALTRVWAALWGLGQDPEPVRDALVRIAVQPTVMRVHGVESGLMTGDRDAPRRLLGILGGGLPGRAAPTAEPWESGYAVALASLVADDDPLGPAVVQAAELLARRLTAAHPEDADVLAWLLLGER